MYNKESELIMKKYFVLFFLLLLVRNDFLSVTQSGQQQKIVVNKINKEALLKLLKERNNKPLFLNLWATWCLPCKEEFPTINKLSKEFNDVEFIGISIDYPEEVNTKIIPFLKSQNIVFTCYVNGFEKDEELINTLDGNWNGALPATFIYDKNGNRVSFLEGKKSYEEFKKEIEKVRK